MLHMISALCVAHDLHTIVPWPLERIYVGDSLQRHEEMVISNCAFEAIIIFFVLSLAGLLNWADIALRPLFFHVSAQILHIRLTLSD